MATHYVYIQNRKEAHRWQHTHCGPRGQKSNDWALKHTAQKYSCCRPFTYCWPYRKLFTQVPRLAFHTHSVCSSRLQKSVTCLLSCTFFHRRMSRRHPRRADFAPSCSDVSSAPTSSPAGRRQERLREPGLKWDQPSEGMKSLGRSSWSSEAQHE